MAKVYISEYKTLTRDNRGHMLPGGQEPAAIEQNVEISGGSLQSEPFGENVRFVRIHAEASCSLLFGADPVATTDVKRMPAGATEYFGVQPGLKLAVISN